MWEKVKEDYFTHDDLIDAYLQGKSDQKDESKKILMQHLSGNVDRATSIIESVYHKIKNDFKITVSSVSLKIDSISYFEALITVDRSNFLADEFMKVYEFATSIKKQNNNDTFFISFTFMPYSSELNMDCIHSDGFILEYAKK